MNKKIIFFDPHNDGCSFYRIQTPEKCLSYKYNQIYKLKQLPTQYDSLYDNIDVFIFHCLELPYFHTHFFPWLKSKKKKIIIDMDDNLWEIPEYNRASVFYNESKLDNLTKNIKLADVVVCSTKPLADYISSNFNKNVSIIPNMITGIYNYRKSNSIVPSVMWAGSPTHEGDFPQELITVIQQLVSNKKIEFSIFGELPSFFKYNIDIKHIKWCVVEKYTETLHNINADIGLIICKDNLFNQSKSNVKFLEYSNCSMVSVADNVYPYSNTIRHNDTGFLVKQPEDWSKYLNMLIDDVNLRNTLSYNAHTFVNTNYNIGTNFDSYISKWEDVL